MAHGRKTGGRVAGTPNKATADVKALAQVHGPTAIKELARIASEGESEAARVSAIKEILDRAYGKSTTIIAGDQENPLKHVMRVVLAPLSDADGQD